MLIHKTRNDQYHYPTFQLMNDPTLANIYSRLHYKDLNWISVVIGDTGSGKSGSAISLAINIDVDHSGHTRWYKKVDGKVILDKICFSVQSFLDVVKKDYPPGTIIIWDEAGIENDNTEWNTVKSKMVKHVLQTFRYKNWGLILTVPDIKSIAIGTRRLLHTKIVVSDTGSVRFPRNKVRMAKIYWQKKNRITADIRWVRDIYKDPTDINRYNKIVSHPIPKPPQEVYDAYNKAKQKQLDEWYSGMQEDLNLAYKELKMDKQKLESKFDFKEGMNYVIQHSLEFINPKTKKFSKDLIGYDLGWNKSNSVKLASILNIKLLQGKINLDQQKKGDNVDYEVGSMITSENK